MRRVGGWLLAASIVVGGCAVDTDSGPRPVDPEILERGEPAPRNAITPGEAVLLYLLAPDATGDGVRLRAVGRDAQPTALGIMSALSQGPTGAEVGERLRTALPAGLRVWSVSQAAGVLTVDVSGVLEQVAGDELVDAVAQLVFTGTSLPGIDAVAITVDGTARQWPAGDGVLIGRPLTRYDFPGYLSSAQPAYPPLPSRVEDLVVDDDQPKNTSATS